jgi:hypothetical protein
LSLAIKEQHILRNVWEDGAKKIFGPQRDEIIELWTKLHNDELDILYPSPNISRMIKLWMHIRVRMWLSNYMTF